MNQNCYPVLGVVSDTGQFTDLEANLPDVIPSIQADTVEQRSNVRYHTLGTIDQVLGNVCGI